MTESTTPNYFTEMIDLALAALGGKALFANDEFFAPKENLLERGRGVFIPDKYTENGKWMDGWETRRKRVPGYDFCIIKLGLAGKIHGFNVDTNHFLGNFPEHCSISAAVIDSSESDCLAKNSDDTNILYFNDVEWDELLPKSLLQGGSENFFHVKKDIFRNKRYTHVKLNIYPDGGVARFRVHGEVMPNWDSFKKDELIDLASVVNGGVALLCNDMFFSHRNNLIMPGRSSNMGDGWETRRKRTQGNDWIIIKLAKQGIIKRIEVDTNHFKGNFPESCSIEGAFLGDVPTNFLTSRSIEWHEILPRTKLTAHSQHFFDDVIKSHNKLTHVRFNIFPDGGVSRLRLWGE